MGSYNKVLLMGNLTRDVELKYTPGNQAVANIGLAVNRRFKTKEGEMKDEATFVDCEAWGYTAENINKFFSKGRPIFIEGRLKLDQWQDKDGSNRSKLKVVVESFEFVDSKGGGGAGGASGSEGPGATSRPGTAAASRPQGAYTSAPSSSQHQPLGEDDIPF
jgi:single-strand DNA-binding protein